MKHSLIPSECVLLIPPNYKSKHYHSILGVFIGTVVSSPPFLTYRLVREENPPWTVLRVFGYVSGASAWGADRLGYLSPFAYAYTNGTSAMVSTRPSSFILCTLVNAVILVLKWWGWSIVCMHSNTQKKHHVLCYLWATSFCIYLPHIYRVLLSLFYSTIGLPTL